MSTLADRLQLESMGLEMYERFRVAVHRNKDMQLPPWTSLTADERQIWRDMARGAPTGLGGRGPVRGLAA